LRQRNPQQPQPLPPPQEEEEEQPRPEPPSNGDMVSRRNFIAYQRTGTPNAALPISTRSLGSYRNKIVFILVVTSFYTAFLYQRGQYAVLVDTYTHTYFRSL
jgi:hypothetical protein